MSLLSKINGPADLKRLKREQLPQLAQEIRDRLIECVSLTGGHIGASLGVVELSIALLYEFDSPKDRIVWDVGHQAYAWKLLTGRNDPFPTLRQRDGISGFLKRTESEHDHFGAGHAGTAMSAALGMATARDLKGEDYKVVGGRGRRGADLRSLVRGDEQRGSLRPRHHPHHQRQRDVHLTQRRRHSQDAGPHRRRSAHQPASREGQEDDLRAARGSSARGWWISRRTSRRASRISSRRACSSRSSASAISARSTGTISPSSAIRCASCAA